MRNQASQFNSTASLFQQAASTHEAQKDPIRQALNPSNLSCYQQLGRWKEANKAITDSIALLEVTLETKPEQLLALVQRCDI